MSHLLAKVNTTLNTISAQARSLGTAAITWSNKLPNPYGRNPQRKAQIESLIVDFDKDNGLNAVSAEAVSVEHEGGTNPNEPNHVTVRFEKDNGHVTVRHVPV